MSESPAEQGPGNANPEETGPLMDPSLPPSLDPTSGTTSDESPDHLRPQNDEDADPV